MEVSNLLKLNTSNVGGNGADHDLVAFWRDRDLFPAVRSKTLILVSAAVRIVLPGLFLRFDVELHIFLARPGNSRLGLFSAGVSESAVDTSRITSHVLFCGRSRLRRRLGEVRVEISRLQIVHESVHPPTPAELPHTRTHSLELRRGVILLREPRRLPVMFEHTLELNPRVSDIPTYIDLGYDCIPVAPRILSCISPNAT